jgi:uncharacterized membrane protein YhaH (DUF805 family)
MTIQQWLFSFKGRIGRRDFWIWIVIWVLAMARCFTRSVLNFWPAKRRVYAGLPALANGGVMVKRLHDRNKSGSWALL